MVPRCTCATAFVSTRKVTEEMIPRAVERHLKDNTRVTAHYCWCNLCLFKEEFSGMVWLMYLQGKCFRLPFSLRDALLPLRALFLALWIEVLHFPHVDLGIHGIPSIVFPEKEQDCSHRPPSSLLFLTGHSVKKHYEYKVLDVVCAVTLNLVHLRN